MSRPHPVPTASEREDRRGRHRDAPLTSRGARHQQWEALLTNRSKRHRTGTFLIHGVRPITCALAARWPLVELLVRADGHRLSQWAQDVVADADVPVTWLSADLMADLGEKDEHAPELIAVGASASWGLDRLTSARPPFIVVADRMARPGNLGTLIRSADAFGATGVVLTGHGADVYDPRTVRGSTGSLFTVPTESAAGPGPLLEHLSGAGPAATVIALDENGDDRLDRIDLTGPVVLVVGSESTGLSAAWREASAVTASVPITGSASSLNAAAAASVALYEVARQRDFPLR